MTTMMRMSWTSLTPLIELVTALVELHQHQHQHQHQLQHGALRSASRLFSLLQIAHCFLCSFQWAFWHSLLQYLAREQLMHC